MKTTKDQQTQTYLSLQTTYLADSTTEEPDQPALFDPSSLQHKAKLYDWCRTHWPIFCRSLCHQNAVYYHECCNCFSRRHFSKVAGHRSLQTSSLATITSFKEVRTADDFFRWLLKMLTYNTKKGQQCMFPAINRYHQEVEVKPVKQEVEEEETTMLKKRVIDLNQQLLALKEDTLKTQKENQRLLDSTRLWYQKYQDLLEYEKTRLEYMTPHKVGRKCSFFEDN